MSPAKEQQQKTTKLDNASIDFPNAMAAISSMVKATVPYIWAVTHEESRLITDIRLHVAGPLNKELYIWSVYHGIVSFDEYRENKQGVAMCSGDWEKTQNPTKAIEAIAQHKLTPGKTGAIFIMKDFHTVMAQPLPRQLRDFHRAMINKKLVVLMLSPVLAHGQSGRSPGIEPTMEKIVKVVNFELPDRAQIDKQVRDVVHQLKNNIKKKTSAIITDYSEDEIEKFVTALQGLTAQEVGEALKVSVCHLRELNERSLLNQKKQIVQRSEILEFIGATPSMNDVGGLDAAKEYFDTYSKQFSKEAAAFGVEPLRGVLLTGVPGTGKSLLAKAIAALWNLPLLRLDVGKVMTGLVGGSEEKMRQVIGQVEAIAPCILWIDEIEKSLSGTKSSNFSDGGTLARVFGTLLTAMEERMGGVVCIATANDIQALPPELIRRFNEVMFVDLPLELERAEIFEIHLRKRGRNAEKLNIKMDELVQASNRYTGSEIEKAVKEAIARAFRKGKKEVDQEDLLGAIKDTKCIATVMKDKIDAIRGWARNKARYASSLAAQASAPGNQKVLTESGKELDVGEALEDIDELKKEQAIKEDSKLTDEFSDVESILDD